MARPWRIQYENAVYHIASRGNGKQNIFLDDTDRKDFLELLKAASERFNLQIFAFCLMSNHYHLLLRTPDANLSSAMQWLNTTFAARFMVRHHRGGHLFQGRFKSVLVEDEEHWQHLSYYLHLNPVRAGMVENPAQYPWSSYLDYIRLKTRYQWLIRDQVLAGLARTKTRQRRNYRRQCLELAKKKTEFWKDVRDAVIIGSSDFIQKIKKQFAPKGKNKEVVEYQKAARPEIDISEELKKLAKALGVKTEDFRARADRLPARLIAYHHLVKNCGLKETEVADHFGVSIHAVSKGLRRLQSKMIADRTLQKVMEMSNV